MKVIDFEVIRVRNLYDFWVRGLKLTGFLRMEFESYTVDGYAIIFFIFKIFFIFSWKKGRIGPVTEVNFIILIWK